MRNKDNRKISRSVPGDFLMLISNVYDIITAVTAKIRSDRKRYMHERDNL